MAKKNKRISSAVFKYSIEFLPESQEQLTRLKISEPSSFEKAMLLIKDLEQHPRMDGIGHPEPLTGNLKGLWSRRITQKHRLIYQIDDTKKVVRILCTCGHYDDK